MKKNMLLSKRFWGSCSFVAAEFVPYEKEVEPAIWQDIFEDVCSCVTIIQGSSERAQECGTTAVEQYHWLVSRSGLLHFEQSSQINRKMYANKRVSKSCLHPLAPPPLPQLKCHEMLSPCCKRWRCWGKAQGTCSIFCASTAFSKNMMEFQSCATHWWIPSSTRVTLSAEGLAVMPSWHRINMYWHCCIKKEELCKKDRELRSTLASFMAALISCLCTERTDKYDGDHRCTQTYVHGT